MEEKILKLQEKTFVAIDWANVYGWSRKLGWEIDPKKLYQYLISYPEIEKVHFYFGVEIGNEKSEQFQKEIKKIGYELISKEVKWTTVSLENSHFKKILKDSSYILDSDSEFIEKLWIKSVDLFDIIDDITFLQGGKPLFRSTLEAVTDKSKAKNFNLSPFSKKAYLMMIDFSFEIEKLLNGLENVRNNLKEVLNQFIKRRKCDLDIEVAIDVYNNLSNFETLLIFSGDGDYAPLVKDLISKGKKVIVVFASGHKGKEYKDFKRGLFLCSVEKFKPFIKK